MLLDQIIVHGIKAVMCGVALTLCKAPSEHADMIGQFRQWLTQDYVQFHTFCSFSLIFLCFQDRPDQFRPRRLRVELRPFGIDPC